MNKSYLKRDASDCIGCCDICPYKEEGALYEPCEELNTFFANEEKEKNLEERIRVLQQNIPEFLKWRHLGFLAKLKD